MSAQHTAGPCFIFGNGHCIGGATDNPEGLPQTAGIALCSMSRRSTEENQANARRLAACWNACVGVSTERLEQAPLFARTTLTDAEISTICAALGIKWYVPDDSERYVWTSINLDELQRIVRAAVAKATGSAS